MCRQSDAIAQRHKAANSLARVCLTIIPAAVAATLSAAAAAEVNPVIPDEEVDLLRQLDELDSCDD